MNLPGELHRERERERGESQHLETAAIGNHLKTAKKKEIRC